MAYKISEDCVSCGACANECPVGAISQGDTQFEIDADSCIVNTRVSLIDIVQFPLFTRFVLSNM